MGYYSLLEGVKYKNMYVFCCTVTCYSVSALVSDLSFYSSTLHCIYKLCSCHHVFSFAVFSSFVGFSDKRFEFSYIYETRMIMSVVLVNLNELNSVHDMAFFVCVLVSVFAPVLAA